MNANLLALLATLLISGLEFISGSSADFDNFGLTQLHRAILDDRTSSVEQLLAEKSLIDIPDKFSKNTPLHLLVEKVGSLTGDKQAKTIELIKKLVNAGVRRDIQTDSGFTALNKAVFLASDLAEYPLEVVQILLKGCVAINTPTRNQTPLHFAAGSRLRNNRAKELVELLMKDCGSSINYNALNSYKWTALKVALAADNMDAVALLQPRTSSISSTLMWVLIAISILLIAAASGSYYYFFIYKKSAAVNPGSDDKANSPTVSATEASPALSKGESVSSTGKEKEN